MPTAFAGKLLVANPQLADPNFERTVVLLLAHGEEGTLGVVLNRPSDTEVGEALPQWSERVSQPALMFVGGPASHDSVICVARVPVPSTLEARAGGEVWRSVSGDLGTLDLDTDPQLTDGAVGPSRIFAGYAGWSAGQLEAEMAAGGWWLLDAEPADPFCRRPGDLWHDVLRRQGGELAIVAAYPPDPELN